MSLHIGEQDGGELDNDREHGDTVTRSPEHADEYVCEPLPGERWIRVLILEPALELDCPLVARLELLSLGPASLRPPRKHRGHEAPDKDGYIAKVEPTEDEKRQHEAYVSLVNARRLPYTAVSYSWAMDNGDDSRSRMLTLHGKQVSITQNLSEGLRRIRLKTDSQRLWVDALCIDQQNKAERSAQVAMMADIFELARRCIVWLGEGPTKESDLAVWQLSHCISPDLDTEAMNLVRLPGNYHEIAVTVLNAMMAVDTSRCTVHVCNGRHPQLGNPAFADTTLVRFVRGRCAAIRPRLHYRLYLRFMLRSPLKTIERRISMIKEWLGRRYWQRRWIVQENASRNHSSGAADYHWGEFSLSRKRLQAMLRVLSIVRERYPPMPCYHFGSISTEGPLAVMQAGTEQSQDLCDHLATHNTLECSDARDRLYSLVTLDPDYGVHVDYTLPMREVCIEFSKLMVRKGDYLRLLWARAQNRPREHSLDLPSWVLDLRLAWNFPNKCTSDRPGNAVVDASLQLSMELNLVGFLAAMEQGPHGTRNRYLVMEPHGVRLTPEKKTSRKWSDSARSKIFLEPLGDYYTCSGDVLYAADYDHWHDCLVWLRPVNGEPPLQHRIIEVFYPGALQISINGNVQGLYRSEYEFTEDSLRTVHIV